MQGEEVRRSFHRVALIDPGIDFMRLSHAGSVLLRGMRDTSHGIHSFVDTPKAIDEGRHAEVPGRAFA